MKQRGSAFILALVAIVVLAAVLATAAANTRTMLKGQAHRIDEQRAERMAEAAIQFAIAQMLTVDTATVTFDDDWALIGEAGDEAIYVGDGYFRVEIVDAGSRVNLNLATQEQFEILGLLPDQIDSILDWREPDLQPRIEGAKDEYYNALTDPYNVKLADFDTVDELLMVKGIDAQTLYEPPTETSGATTLLGGAVEDLPPLYDILTVDSESPNVTPSGQPKLNVNTGPESEMVDLGIPEDLADAITDRRRDEGTFASWTELFQVPGVTMQNVGVLLDILTFATTNESRGMINVNTATEAALFSIPGLTSDIIQAILDRQGTFITLGDLAGIPGMTLNTLGEIAGMTTTGSQSFVVRVMGVFGGRTVALQAFVVLGDFGPEIRRTVRFPFADVAFRWGWNEEAGFDSELID